MFPLAAFNQRVVFSILVISSMFDKYIQTKAFKTYHDQRCTIITPDTAKQLKGIPECSNVLLHILDKLSEFETIIEHFRGLRVQGKNKGKCFALIHKTLRTSHSVFDDAQAIMQFGSRTPIVYVPGGLPTRLWKVAVVYELFE